MSNINQNLLDVDDESPNWLENDDDLTIKPDDIGTKPYIPDDDVAFNAGPSTFAASIPNDSSAQHQTTIPNNFEGGIFTLNHYRRYFDINTGDFFLNILNSFNILNKIENESELGDFYGPLWVTATVIFILFFANTSSNLLVSWFSGSKDSYQYNFNLLTGAISLLYGYTFVIPVVFYFLSVFYLKLTNFLTLSKIISIYGYANSSWVPAAILSILRGVLVNHKTLSSILKWVSVLVGGLISGACIISKLFPIVKNSTAIQGNEKLAYILISALVLAHAGFIIAVKVLFFGDLNVVN